MDSFAAMRRAIVASVVTEKTMKTLLREPLLHFFLLGALIFVLASALGGAGSTNDPIVVGEEQVTLLAEGFRRTWQRPPTESELSGLVEDYVKEEVFYREAVAMGLDRDDTVIRRRLRQKLEFMSEDIAAQAQPTEQELQAFLSEDADRFRIEGPMSFVHVYFNFDRRGENARTDAAALLARLDADPELGNDISALGDRLPLPASYESVTETEIARLFGQPFAERLRDVGPGAWTGPLESGYGLHLVFVSEKEDDRLPQLAEVRDEVVREWRVRQRERTDDAFYRELRDKYDVRVQLPEWAQPASSASEPR